LEYQKLGHYELLSELGAGGMGLVYRALDTKLHREVAVKVLPENFAKDPVRLARFEREAKMVAALNHPNIAAIYGFEKHEDIYYIVLELVEGSDLSVLLKSGPLPVDEALKIMRQVAKALDAAHRKGVIHRDLKPGNIKVTPTGEAKVLDFGLAKSTDEDKKGSSNDDTTTSPTGGLGDTIHGVVLGTAAYMSPEQARGKPVDKRTDIWAFGAVLFECLCGRRAFRGETASDTIAKILEREPPWSELPEKTPPILRRLLQRCMTKDPDMRLHDIADARVELEEVISDPSSSSLSFTLPGLEEPKPKVNKKKRLALAVYFFILGAIASAIFNLVFHKSPVIPPQEVVRFTVPLDPPSTWSDRELPFALSLDGSRMLFLDGSEGGRLLLRELTAFNPTTVVLPDHDFTGTPLFSPDGQWICYQAGSQLKRASLSGGAPIVLRDRVPSGVSITPTGDVVCQLEPGGALWKQASVAGAQPVQLTTVDEAAGEKGHLWPEVLPAGNRVLFTIRTGPSFDDAWIGFADLTTGQHIVVLKGGTSARYAPSGHLVYARGGTLMAAPFDPVRGQTLSTPVPVVEGVRYDPNTGISFFTVAANGTLAYLPAESGPPGEIRTVVNWAQELATRAPQP